MALFFHPCGSEMRGNHSSYFTWKALVKYGKYWIREIEKGLKNFVCSRLCFDLCYQMWLSVCRTRNKPWTWQVLPSFPLSPLILPLELKTVWFPVQALPQHLSSQEADISPFIAPSFHLYLKHIHGHQSFYRASCLSMLAWGVGGWEIVWNCGVNF